MGEILNYFLKRKFKLVIFSAIIIIAFFFMERGKLDTLFLLKNGLKFTAPIGFIAIGETISERAGIINVGVEGTALMGALGTAWTTFITGNPWIGILGGLTVGGALGLLHGIWCIRWRANQIVSGIAINIVAIGLAYIIPSTVWGWRGTSVYLPRASVWVLIGLLFVIIAVVQYFLFKTLWGLRLRTTGDRPEAVDIAGWDVHRTRYMAVLLNGILCGLAGGFFMSYTGRFTEGMVGGRGYMGIAAVVVGGYVPVWAFGASMLFGFVFALQMKLQQFIPSQFALMLPYIVTVLALAGFLGEVEVPNALGKSYIRE